MVDLRQEMLLRGHEITSAGRGDSRVGALMSSEDGLLRAGPWLSPNARKMYQELTGPDWLKYLKLADKIEQGDADQSNDEQDTLYDGMPVLTDTVIDLFNMVSRRDEQIDALNAQLDSLARLGAALHNGQAARDALIAFSGARAAVKAQV